MAGTDIPRLISKVTVELDPFEGRPKVRARVAFDYGLVRIRGVRVVRVKDGTLRVIFPDACVTVPCDGCKAPVPIIHGYCQSCGRKQPFREPKLNANGKKRLFSNLVYPINGAARVTFEQAVMEAYYRESRRPAPKLFVPATA